MAIGKRRQTQATFPSGPDESWAQPVVGMAIERVDIIDQDDGQSRLEVWTGGGGRIIFHFPNREEALSACQTIWSARSSDEASIEHLRRLASTRRH